MDPYKVLEIEKNASNDQIKEAYKKLAKKYHPDNYADHPLSDLASEKMKEINQAYDMIMNQRRGFSGNDYSQGYNENSSNYSDVRKLIMDGRITDAEQILNGVPSNLRDAEWFFLKGSVLFKRGWLEEAYNNFSKANSMDPMNAEYRAAFNRVQQQRNGVFSGYNTTGPGAPGCGCSSCDICTSLLCANCCCDCMGGGC